MASFVDDAVREFEPGGKALLPAFVFCIGLPSSGSTWILNVALQLVSHHSGGSRQVPIFVDETSGVAPAQRGAVIARLLHTQAAPSALEASGCLVIKSHAPGPTMLRMARASRSPIIISIRDPRDAICSLMARFGLDFAQSLTFVTGSANALAALDSTSLVLRYEDGFVGTVPTVRTIAAVMGVACDEADCVRIADELSRERVTARLEALERSGILDPARPASEQFDPCTHWHPRHVSDGRRARWSELLTVGENAEVVRSVRPFLVRFGYSPELPPVSVDETIRFNAGAEGVGYLISGFSSPEDWGTWTCETTAVLRIPLVVPARAALSVQMECRLGPSLLLDTGSTAVISVNGRDLLRIGAQGGGYVLHLALGLEGPEVAGCSNIEIGFSFEGLRSPSELGVNTDVRLVGMGLSSVRLNFA